MSKHKHVPAVTTAAKQAGQIALPGLARRRLTALMEQGETIAAQLKNGHQRSLQVVSTSKEGLFGRLKHGNTVIDFEGDTFGVTTHD